MPWNYYYETATGKLVSEDDAAVPASIPGLSVRTYQSRRTQGGADMWDEATQDFVQKPPPVLIDRMDDLLTHPDFSDFQQLWSALNPGQQNRARNALIVLFGRRRFRNPATTHILGDL